MPASSRLVYETFEILVGDRTERGYPVTLLDSPAGNAQGVSLLDGNDPGLRQALEALERRAGDGQLLRQVGAHLFQELFLDDIEERYRTSLGIARSRDQGLRIRLRLAPPELAALPWESLYDPDEEAFLAISAQTALVRYVPMGVPPRPIQATPPLRVLVAMANPTDTDPLDVARERKAIQKALARWVKLGVVELELLERATVTSLDRAIRRFRPHVFHFIGHGLFQDDQALLVLEDQAGMAQPLDDATFRELFLDVDETRVVLLNACETGVTSGVQPLVGFAPRLLQRQLAGVVAMQFPIADRASQLFAWEFYRHLALGHPLEQAVAEGRRAIFLALGEAGPDWAAPVLFLRTEEGTIWDLALEEKVARQVTESRLSRFALAPRLSLTIAALTLVAILGLLAFRTISPPAPPPPTPTLTPIPAKMTGAFKVAVAQFGELDEQGQVRPDAEAAQLSDWLYQTLEREYAEQVAIPGLEIWHDGPALKQASNVTIGLVAGASPEERIQAAEAMAQRLNVDVIIYGHLAGPANPRDLFLEFYVSPDLEFSPDLNRGIDPVVGRHRLGQPIPVTLPLSTLAGLEANDRLDVRTRALAWLTIGLAFDLVNPSRARAIFRQAEERLQDWPDAPGSGKEILYFFIGQEELLLANLEAAEAYFRQALAINPAYARATIGLGGVYYSRAQELPPEERVDVDFTEQALAFYQQALEEAPSSSWPPTEAIALVALGMTHRLQGETFNALGQLEQADQALDQAQTTLTRAVQALEPLEQPRFLAHAYLVLGATYHLQANLRLRQGRQAQATPLLQEALESYGRCVAQAELAPLDKVLTQFYVAERCQPYQQQVQQDLSSLEEESG